MKPIIYPSCIVALLYLQSCGGGLIKHKGDSDHTSIVSSKIPVPVSTDNLIVNDAKDLTGYWVGTWDSSYIMYENEESIKINISIDEIIGNNVKGHTVIAGKARFFNCKMVEAGSTYQFTFKGGADEKADGIFELGIAKGDSVIIGSWDAGSKISAQYKLTKHYFKYNPNWKLTSAQYIDVDKPKYTAAKSDKEDDYEHDYATTTSEVYKHNASAELLTKEYVANLKKADLLVLRNSIFARHGYTFKKPVLNSYFSQQPWYVPLSTDVTAQLTALEKKNIALMAPYEKDAKEYYEGFGRG